MQGQKVLLCVFFSPQTTTRFINALNLQENHSDDEIAGTLERFKWRLPDYDFWLATDENTEQPHQAWQWDHLHETVAKVADPKHVLLIKPHPIFMMSPDIPASWIIADKLRDFERIVNVLGSREETALKRHVFERLPQTTRTEIIRIPIRIRAPQQGPPSTLFELFNPAFSAAAAPDPSFWDPVPVPERRKPLDEETKKRLREKPPSEPKETKRTKEDNTCVICADNAKEVVCIPCGHFCMCPVCMEEILTRESLGDCPVCRAKITSVQRIIIE